MIILRITGGSHLAREKSWGTIRDGFVCSDGDEFVWLSPFICSPACRNSQDPLRFKAVNDPAITRLPNTTSVSVKEASVFWIKHKTAMGFSFVVCQDEAPLPVSNRLQLRFDGGVGPHVVAVQSHCFTKSGCPLEGIDKDSRSFVTF
jgi:hypothetical protein